MTTGTLLINKTEIDLADRIPFPLNFSVADIKQPQKRKRNFSREIKLPGTPRNMNFFSSTYDLSLSTLDNTTLTGFDFDPTIRTEAKYYKKGIIVFDGLIQVKSVEIIDGKYTFICQLYSDFVDLFMTLKDIDVSELGWSEYDHILNRTNVKDSWDTSVIVDGLPVPNFTSGNPDGFGYLYPLVNYGYSLQSPTTYKTSDIVPHVYWREIIEKCLNLAGVTYISNWLDSKLVKKFIYGFGGGEKPSLSAADIAQRQTEFHGDFSNSQEKTYSSQFYNSAPAPLTPYYQLTFPAFDSVSLFQNTNFTETIDQDTLSQYEPTTGEITVSLSGRYKIEIDGVLDLTLGTGAMTVQSQGAIKGISIKKNGTVIPSGSIIFGTIFGPETFSKSVELDLVTSDILTAEIYFSGNVSTRVDELSDAESVTLDIVDTTDINFNLTSIETSITDGATVNLSRFIPKMKADKFLSAVIKAGNLMISDPDIDGVVEIEPLEDYYQDTDEFDDITDIVDHSKPIKINPPSSTIEGRFYDFLWASDNDYDNKRYREVYEIGYGDKSYEVQSTFQRGTRKYQLPFAQTVPVDIVNTTLVIPRIIKFDDSTNITKPFKGKPRVYIYNGLKSGSWRLTNTDIPSSYDSLTTYPCVHHLDDKDNPSFDLNFGVPKILYYSANGYTTDNLFSRYHERFVREITSADAKLVELFLKTNSNRINKLDFSLLKMWNGVLYRLNEITDFDDDVTDSTRYELVKVIQANSPKRFSIPSGTSPIKDIRDISVISGGQNDINEDVTVLTGGVKGVSISSSITKNS